MKVRAELVSIVLAACTQAVVDDGARRPAGGDPPGGDPATLVCAPGEPVYCRCDDGAAGAATCLGEGRRGPCHCDAPTPDPVDIAGEQSAPPVPPTQACPAAPNGCYVEPADGPMCPCARARNDPAHPAWRVTSLDLVAPAPLREGPVGALLTLAVREGAVMVGLDADLARGVARFGRLDRRRVRRGAVGTGLLDARFGFFAGDADGPDPRRFDPLSVPIALAHSGFGATQALPGWDLPVAAVDGGAPGELHLCDLRIDRVGLDDDLGCVGRALPRDGAFDECDARWDVTDGAELTAAVSTTSARGLAVDASGRTLCDVLAGTSCGSSMSQWRNRPDTWACGDPAWRLIFRLAAVAARIDR